MSTMTLVDEYIDALLDGGAQHDTDTDAGPTPASAAGPMPDPVDDPVHRPIPGRVREAEPDPAPAAFAARAIVTSAATPAATPIAAAHASAPAAMAAAHRWLRVCVGDDSYALELLRVQEVVRLAPIVALRGTARAVLGVMNLRGRIVPVVDLGLWLDAGRVHGDERSRIVVVDRDDEMIGVLVSAVEDVVTLGRERIEPPLASSDPGAIVGIARIGAAPTVLLDASALFG